jgi:hypothetical protein
MRIQLTLTALIGLLFVGCLAPATAPGVGGGYYREGWFIDRDHHRWRDHDHYDHHHHDRGHGHGHRGH